MAPLISPCLHVPDDSSHTLSCCFPEHDDMGDWLGYSSRRDRRRGDSFCAVQECPCLPPHGRTDPAAVAA